MIDATWNAAGFAQSDYYDEQGNWVGEERRQAQLFLSVFRGASRRMRRDPALVNRTPDAPGFGLRLRSRARQGGHDCHRFDGSLC
jgi:hypothetical protein